MSTLRCCATGFRYLIFGLPWILASCADLKDDLTMPAEVSFQFKLDREATQGNVLFDAGSFDVKSITFTGDRDTGEDITFMSDFGTVVLTNLGTGTSAPPVSFDVPQGTYNSITLLVDPDDTAPDIVVMGEYQPLVVGAPIPLQLEIEIGGALNLVAKNPDGNPRIVLDRSSPATVEIFLNPTKWFSQLPAAALEAAELKDIGGVPSIVISKSFNTNLYSSLSGLVEGSAEAVFSN